MRPDTFFTSEHKDLSRFVTGSPTALALNKTMAGGGAATRGGVKISDE